MVHARVILITFLFFSLEAFTQAQGVDSAIFGTVTDALSSPLSAVAIVIKNTETGVERKLITDDSGRFSAPSLAIGNYQITASKQGFQSATRTGIALVIGQRAEISLQLAVGEIRESVTVVEQATPVNTTTQQTSGLVGEKDVKDLPLNGRSYDQLVTLNPAIVNYSAERSGGIGTSNSAVGNMFAVSGRRPQENLFLLNGIEYTGASLINLTPGGASGQLLGVDAVREFNVVTDTYGAEYGKRPGAQVSIVTAGGTNALHGALYEFIRNSDLDARNFFDQGAIPQFQRNVFGGSLGGPIKKDKLFVFGNYEGFRQHLGLSDVTFVPDNAARQGIVGGVNVGLAPGVAQLLSLWPAQNGPELGGGIAEAFSHPLQKIREDFGTTRLDYNASSNDTISAIYTIDDSNANTPSSNPLSLVFETLREQVASVQELHVFSPTLLNSFRAGFSRAGYFFTGDTPIDLPGFVAGAPVGAVVVGGGTALNGASQITAAGTNAGSNLSAARNLFTYEDHIALTHGIHQIQAGVWIQRIQANDSLAQDQYGQASFSSLTSFLQGTVATFTAVPSPTPLGWRSLEAAGFIQDAIKLRKNLEVRIGFRFESTNGWNEVAGRAANYAFTNGVIQTNPFISSSAFTSNHAKFLPEPRAGLAWDPFGKGRTVIHAGAGIYYALLDDLDYRLDQNAPFNTTVVEKNIPISSAFLTPGHAAPTGSLISPSGIQPDARTPSLVTYTLRIEQQITPSTSISVGYVGSHGFHELLSEDANEPIPAIVNGAPFLRQGRAVSQSESCQHHDLVHQRPQLLQRRRVRRQPAINSRFPDPRRLHFRQESRRRHRDEFERWHQRPRFCDVSRESETRLGPLDVRRSPSRQHSRLLRASVPSRTEEVSRRLVDHRHREFAKRIPIHAAAGLQPIEQWRFAQSRAPLIERRVHGSHHPRRTERIFRPQRVRDSGQRNLRRRRPRYAHRARPRRTRRIGSQEHQTQRTHQSPISSGVLQRRQSRQFRNSERGGVLIGRLRTLLNRGSNLRDLHHLAPNPARSETAFLRWRTLQRAGGHFSARS